MLKIKYINRIIRIIKKCIGDKSFYLDENFIKLFNKIDKKMFSKLIVFPRDEDGEIIEDDWPMDFENRVMNGRLAYISELEYVDIKDLKKIKNLLSDEHTEFEKEAFAYFIVLLGDMYLDSSNLIPTTYGDILEHVHLCLNHNCKGYKKSKCYNCDGEQYNCGKCLKKIYNIIDKELKLKV